MFRPRRPYPSHPQGTLPLRPRHGGQPPDPRSSNAGGAGIGHGPVALLSAGGAGFGHGPRSRSSAPEGLEFAGLGLIFQRVELRRQPVRPSSAGPYHSARPAFQRRPALFSPSSDLDVSASKFGPFDRPQLGGWLARPDEYDARGKWAHLSPWLGTRLPRASSSGRQPRREPATRGSEEGGCHQPSGDVLNRQVQHAAAEFDGWARGLLRCHALTMRYTPGCEQSVRARCPHQHQIIGIKHLPRAESDATGQALNSRNARPHDPLMPSNSALMPNSCGQVGLSASTSCSISSDLEVIPRAADPVPRVLSPGALSCQPRVGPRDTRDKRVRQRWPNIRRYLYSHS